MTTQASTDFADFLINAPPSSTSLLTASTVLEIDVFGESHLRHPPLKLFCDGPDCEGTHWFDSTVEKQHLKTLPIVEYKCRHCKTSKKIYALRVVPVNKNAVSVCKFGEFPPFGPPTPPKLITLFGPDRDIFLKGRRAENQGLGIAAFAYYRRVVENQKNRLFAAIIKIAQEEGTSPEIITGLENAKAETQFKKAIEDLKPGIPESLKISGHNPLTLLHSALSEGLHAESDEECLAKAFDIRNILTRLVEKMDEASKDRTMLQSSLAAINKSAQKKS